MTADRRARIARGVALVQADLDRHVSIRTAINNLIFLVPARGQRRRPGQFTMGDVSIIRGKVEKFERERNMAGGSKFGVLPPQRKATGSLFEEIRAAGIPHDHHESDLYILDTPEARHILTGHGVHSANRSFFTSQIDGKRWIDVPFAYEPWWEARSARHPSTPKKNRVGANFVLSTGRRSGTRAGAHRASRTRRHLGASVNRAGALSDLPVMFRVTKDSDHEVTAVFPTLAGTRDPSSVTVYAHLGQHSTGDWGWVRDRTRPATEQEYAALLGELRRIYERGDQPVRLRVVARATRAMSDERRRQAAA